MFSHLPPRHQYGMLGLAALALAACAYIGGSRLRRPEPMQLSGALSSQEAAQRQSAGRVVVHISGGVKRPGLFRAKEGQRVADAVAFAGGATVDGDLDALNLAAPLNDGDKIVVPRRSELPMGVAVLQPTRRGSYLEGPISAPTTKTKTRATKRNPAKATSIARGGLVSLNTGTQAELETLPGIGPSTARKIIDQRTARGAFGAIEELLDVPGIGPKKLEALRPFVKL